jgi:hypothetical protein
MEELLVAMILADAGVSALVSDRVRWVQAQQGEVKPFVILTRISGSDDPTYREASSLMESRVQVDAYALTYAGAKALARALKSALNTKGSGLAGTIDRIFYDSERDLFDDDQSPDKVYRVSTDYRILHR